MILLEATTTLNPQDFFTWGSFTTLIGATGIVYIVCGAIQQAFNFSPKWFALAISMIVSFIAAYIGIVTLKSIDPKDLSAAQKQMLQQIFIIYLLAIFNGFLIYMTATGTNQLIAPKPPQPPPAPPAHPSPQRTQIPRRSFNSNWWNH